MKRPIRLAARAVLMQDDRLLLVNAWPRSKGSDLWCAPGGGADAHASLPDNLTREVMEGTGLRIAVDAPCLINEFHSPKRQWHQVEVFFRCTILGGVVDDNWHDPEGIVTSRRWVTRAEMETINVRPRALASAAWGEAGAVVYDPLELILE